MVAQYLEKVGYFPVDLIGCPYNPAPIVQRYTKGAGEKVDQVRKVGRENCRRGILTRRIFLRNN